MTAEGLGALAPLVPELLAGRPLAVLTGAGISAESGLPTFRGPDGMWEGRRAVELTTPEAFAANPKEVWRFYEWRRAKLREARPNAAHDALARIETGDPAHDARHAERGRPAPRGRQPQRDRAARHDPEDALHGLRSERTRARRAVPDASAALRLREPAAARRRLVRRDAPRGRVRGGRRGGGRERRLSRRRDVLRRRARVVARDDRRARRREGLRDQPRRRRRSPRSRTAASARARRRCCRCWRTRSSGGPRDGDETTDRGRRIGRLAEKPKEERPREKTASKGSRASGRRGAPGRSSSARAASESPSSSWRTTCSPTAGSRRSSRGARATCARSSTESGPPRPPASRPCSRSRRASPAIPFRRNLSSEIPPRWAATSWNASRERRRRSWAASSSTRRTGS